MAILAITATMAILAITFRNVGADKLLKAHNPIEDFTDVTLMTLLSMMTLMTDESYLVMKVIQ